MSGFQRFISYIYPYQNGSKTRNAGFAKLELRGGQLRAQLHIREPRLFRPARLELFFFAREQEGLRGIRIGELKVENGCGDARIQAQAADVMGSGYRFHQLSGLIIRSEELGRFYGAEWDGQGIQPELFLESGGREGKEVRAAEVSSERAGESVSGLPLGEGVGDENGFLELLREKDSGGHDVNKGTAENTGKPGNRGTTENTEKTEEMYFWNREKMENSESRWAYLCRNYPSIVPFREDDQAECIKIQLKDLQILPMEEWRLCNNSFLLHGYYSYRHLIFGKNRGEGDYFIGVPGTYYPQEKLFAVMTGFPEFKTAAGTVRKTGEFGYWCRQIRYD